MERGKFRDVEYISLDAEDCIFHYIKDSNNPISMHRSLSIRSMTKGHTSISISDDELIMFQFKVNDDIKKFLIDALTGGS